MKPLFSIAAIVGTILLIGGCGPMKSGPLPTPLTDEDQRTVDESWERALTPVNRLDREPLLDALIITQGYQLGVDRLTLRSEKDFSGGVVVMEIHVTRKRPVDDRFELTVLSKTGQVLRKFSYSREEVERVQRELCESKYACKDPTEPLANDYEVRKRAEIQARLRAVEQIFPKLADPEQQVEDEPRAGK